MDIQSLVKENELEPLMLLGSFGLEKEGVRTNKKYELALSDHPSELGDRAFHPYIQTDFSEAQLELVTPPLETLEETYQWLTALHDVAVRSLENEETIWPFSMPSILPDEENIPIIRVSDQNEIDYREQLAEKYGKKKQLISGIHFNFAFSDVLIDALFEKQKEYQSKKEYKNELHLKLTRNFLRYQWLLTYLFGASPVADDSFFEAARPEGYVRSLRNSSFGYHNDKNIKVNYDTLDSYVEDILNLTQEGVLSETREYYGAARLRGKSKELEEILSTGLHYVEFRSFDLNPLNELGFSLEQAQFVHLFFLSMIWMESTVSVEEIETGRKMNEATALEEPFSPSQYQEEGMQLIQLMKRMVDDLSLEETDKQLIHQAEEALKDPEKTLAAKIVTELEKEKDFLSFGYTLSQTYKKEAWKKPFLLRGFDTMEMSTQLLLFDALQLGIEVTVLDELDQFVKLEHQNHVEYVKNGNMTGKDTYISHWIMENKTVSKKILKDHGFIVPEGEEYQTIEEAVAGFYTFKDKAFVVKPKSTNYGLGISIFKKTPTLEDFKEALDIAFKEDESVLVEEFATGTEYRFFVLDGEVQAVLLRVPANVVGDGEHSISELIDQKNDDPLRGMNHRAPLEKIQKTNLEKLMLKEQGYDFDSVPPEGETVYLRENSNISTGGDSIDFTDKMHESYKKIAAKMAEPIGVRVTGVDLIIPDYTKPSTDEEPGYTCIEANFNPAMHMHAYVYEGKGRRLTKGILNMLFPELKEKNE